MLAACFEHTHPRLLVFCFCTFWTKRGETVLTTLEKLETMTVNDNWQVVCFDWCMLLECPDGPR